jgi:hypothetical protein
MRVPQITAVSRPSPRYAGRRHAYRPPTKTFSMKTDRLPRAHGGFPRPGPRRAVGRVAAGYVRRVADIARSLGRRLLLAAVSGFRGPASSGCRVEADDCVLSWRRPARASGPPVQPLGGPPCRTARKGTGQYRDAPSPVPCGSRRPGSRRLHAGHHLASKRISARLIPE